MKAVTRTATSVASGSRPNCSRIESNAGRIESIASAVVAIDIDITTVNATDPGRSVRRGKEAGACSVIGVEAMPVVEAPVRRTQLASTRREAASGLS